MTPDMECDLLVIGCGMAGMAASLFAANRNLRVVQAGAVSELNFASGYLDLLGVHPFQNQQKRRRPWQALDELREALPRHPYARISNDRIRAAFTEFTDFLASAGVPYSGANDTNSSALTPVGTLKPTFRVPLSMWKGLRTMAEKTPCLILDIQGLKGFSARQIAETAAKFHPGIRTARIPFPGSEHEHYTEHMALALEQAETLHDFAEIIRPHLGAGKVIGLPAILGLRRSQKVIAELESLLERDIFEIPTLPPAVPGLRLRKAFEASFPQLGIHALHQKRVLSAKPETGGRFFVEIGDIETETRVRAASVLLATGRFFGKGLMADRQRVTESVFNLPVTQPENRRQWHRTNFLAPEGHPLNQAGLEIDADFHPLNPDGTPAFPNLYAAGSILAHQDWMRQKCGSGLAISTAFGAVEACVKYEKKYRP